MKAIELAVRRFAIGLALKKPAPDTVPLTGEERLRERDYYLVTLGTLDAEMFVVDKLVPEGVDGLEWAGRGTNSVRKIIRNPLILSRPLKIKHYFRELEFIYGPKEFALTAVLPLSRYHWWRYTVRIWRFGQTLVVRQDRHVVLKWAYEQHLGDPEKKIDVYRYLEHSMGPIWGHHPKADEQINHYSLVFESLAETGDLRSSDTLAYELEPKALGTLANHEAEDRRHDDSVRQQRKMSRLTLGLLIVGVPAAADAMIKLITALIGWIGP